MRFFKSGVITAIIATTAFVEPKGASYAASKYEIQSGTVSVKFFTNAFEIFESAGQGLVGLENTVTPAPDFQAGFNILPPSLHSNQRGSNFTFDYDFNTQTFNSFNGAIETTGNFVLKNDTTRLPLPEIQRLGNYTIGFDNSTNNFFLKDNLDAQVTTGNLALKSPSTFDGKNLVIRTDLLFSKKTSDLLMKGGAINTFGFKGGEALIVATATQVPEPNLILGIIGVIPIIYSQMKKVKK